MKAIRFAAFLTAVAGAFASSAATKLLPGSISFNEPALWGTTVQWRSNDQGTLGGDSYWYFGMVTESSEIKQHEGKASGYLYAFAANGIHRTLDAVTDKTGPAVADGRQITKDGLFLDTKLTLPSYRRASDGSPNQPKIDLAKDKLVLWTYSDSYDGSASATLKVAAGRITEAGELVCTNIVTDRKGFADGVQVRLTIKAKCGVDLGNDFVGYGFEVWVDDVLVTYDGGKTVFPSLQQDFAGDYEGRKRAAKVYSLGFVGKGDVDKINFTQINPLENPDYDKDDVSMLQECAEITVDGAPSEMLSNFPILVRISESRIPGFHYERARSNGADIRFTDSNGMIIPHEIDTWNDEFGESVVWVKPALVNQGTKLTMHWNLATGGVLPAVNAYDVWSEYIAVWHMNAVGSSVKDSTGNGYTATVLGGGKLGTMTGDGIVGRAASLDFVDGKHALECASFASALDAYGAFTFSGRYIGNDYQSDKFTDAKGNALGYILYGTKGTNAISKTVGWGGLYYAETTHRYYHDASKYIEDKNLPSLVSNWYTTAFVYDEQKLSTAYFNGSAGSSGTLPMTETYDVFRVMADGLSADEVRVSRKVLSPLWLATENAQMTDSTFVSFGAAQPKGSVNYWIEEPLISPTSWSPEDADKVVLRMGQPRFGSVVVTYRKLNGEVSSEFPTAPGVYKATFTAGDGIVHQRLTKTFNFVIYDKLAYRHVSGYDRVMLFNSDLTPGSEVTLQGFWDVDSKTNLVWSHSYEAWKGTGDFVQDGAFHTYLEPETGNVLWQFRHARIGNLFPNDDVGIIAGQNMLPWNSAYACRYDDSDMPAKRQRYAGWLMLQNVSGIDDPAGVYSPIYSNGVGTIYFDIVNAYTAYSNSVKVQVCHKAAGERVQDGVWVDVPVSVLKVVDGTYSEAIEKTTSIGLAMKDASTNSFYRVRALLDTTEPTRFRIVRTDNAWSTGGVDGPGLIIIDNIIASGPAMGVQIEQLGAPAIPGDTAFRGWRAPFTVPFPTAADLGTLRAAAKVSYIVNGTNTADAAFVGALIMRYRWRYLNQYVDEWKDVVLQPDGDDINRFVSTDALQGQGIGDIEYEFSGIVNAPYYDFVDYSGLGLKWTDGYTERRGDLVIDAANDGVYSESNPSPALGTDYFVRLREGSSLYERFVLRVRRNGAVETVPMSITSDGVWRGFWMMPTNWEGTVEWQIEGDNPQIAGLGEYQWSTNYFCGNKDAEELPVNDMMVSCDTNTWTKVPSDAITGYLLFQIDENTRAVTIIHADYQNFNAWTDANLEDGDANGHFVGTSTADDAKSGVSHQAKNYIDDFANLLPTVPTNSVLWEEHFNVVPVGKYEVGIPFSITTTPNGWGADNGMWMPEEYNDTSVATSIALQLEGEGRGRVRFAISNSPRGLESFNYRARVSQTYDIFSFDYYRGTNDFYNLSDYTFAVPCVMRHGMEGDFEGLGSISAVAYYDDGKGCYEARVDRTAKDMVRVSIYKWYVSGSRIVSKLLAESTDCDYSLTGLNGENTCGALVICCENFEEVDQTRIQAGIYVGSMITRADVAYQVLSGKRYHPVTAIDEEEDRHTCGTVGVGSKNCPASFAAPQLYRKTIEWLESRDERTMTFDTAPSIKQYLIQDEDGYDDWTIRQGRLEKKEQVASPQGWGFVAVPPAQKLIIEVAPKSSQDYTTIAEDTIDTFGFQYFTNMLYVAETMDIRVSTGGTRGDGSSDVTVDDFVAVQWRGNSYDDGENRSAYYNINRGAPTNFVYTTAWVDELHRIELSAMRTVEDEPASIRSPLMDGASGRGLGLGMVSLTYRDADSHARLIVQIATNDIDVTTLSDYTSRFDGWTDVKTFDFSTFSEEELRSGIITCYLGLHGVKGVLRVVVDPSLVKEARDALSNPNNDPQFGSVFVTGISVRDNPMLDSGCWWGWNLRTTDDASFQLLEDGAHEAGNWGLSYALNNSIRDDVRPEDKDAYPKHAPFLQTPVFSSGAVGQISFKARKYSATDPSPTVAIYASTALGTLTEDTDFEYVGEVVVDSERFERYDFIASMTKNYTGFRLVITGVAGVENPGEAPSSGYVERVLIDEVAVFEAIRARMGFKSVGAFRSSLATTDPVDNVPSAAEQPLCNEAFGIQAELFVAQLANTIDTDREPEVFLHWYASGSPWGYSRWASQGKTSQLRRVGDASRWIYRSTYMDGEDAIIPAQSTPGQIVQYSLDVVFYMKGSEDPITNTLSATEWSVPDWFKPIDYNATLGQGKSSLFSAFTILDSVAPGWAWINEVNLFGDRVNYNNTDEARQYIEIAAPVEADLSGWYVRLLGPETSSDSVYTNKLATFGLGGLSAKKATGSNGQALGQASNMVFRVIANQATRTKGELKTADGTLDAVWSVQYPCSAIDYTGTISYYQGFGLQLVRPSGAVEHEIVVCGTNIFSSSLNYSQYHPTNVVKFLNRTMTNADFFHVGDDDGGTPNSVGVFTSQGESNECWTNSLAWTPGRINVGQFINPDHPTPSGDSILIYATLGSDHIHQSVDSVLTVRKGSQIGTNIIYSVDRWYELGSVTTNGAPIAVESSGDSRTYMLNVGRGCSNNITVVASATIDSRIRNLGCDENNAYTPAIMNWLEEAVDVDGNEWPDGDQVYLADHVGIDGEVITNLTLTQMYWLDICPTITNQCLIAYMAKPPMPTKPILDTYKGGEERTNLTMTIYMMMSNRTVDVDSPYYGRAWKPTVIRGLEPGSNSRDYSEATVPWTNATFKITGLLANGLTSESNERNWIPVRFFVFDENSFTSSGTSEIQVADPHSSASPGYAAGWGEWFRKHPDDKSSIFFKWSIDTRLMPITVELLRPTNPLN